MNTPKISRFLFLFVIAALVLSACNNTAAAQPGVWYNPFSWGDQTAEQTAAQIVKAAEAEKTIRDAEAQATAMAGGVPSIVENPAEPATLQASAQVSHDQHLLDLDPTYRSKGWEAWLRAAGIDFDASKVESRQPVEAVINSHVTVTSLVIRATGMKVNWPACITTDHPEMVVTSSDTRQHQPDLRNPSVLYTNATLNGQATVYADCSDWGQLDPSQ